MTYNAEQRKAAAYIEEIAGIGGGEDPVGFVITLHRIALMKLERLYEENKRLRALADNSAQPSHKRRRRSPPPRH